MWLLVCLWVILICLPIPNKCQTIQFLGDSYSSHVRAKAEIPDSHTIRQALYYGYITQLKSSVVDFASGAGIGSGPRPYCLRNGA